MRIKNLTPFVFGVSTTSTRPPVPEMTAIVRGTFDLVPGGTVKVIDGMPLLAQGPLRGDGFRDEDEDRLGECLYPSDFADFKPNAEVLLTGSCHAPRGRPVVECLARFAVGAWSKTLRVSGDRRFTGRGVEGPAGFVTMPLDYAHAFGGPGFAKNPVGKGLDGGELPNVEHPQGLVLSRDNRPEPGCFAPLNPAWPPRAGKVGTKYDRDYQRSRAPYYAEDFDWTFFQAAPADQQLQGYLRGDEELALHNLHPTEPILISRLPGLRVRVFVEYKTGDAREVPMRLDTLLADMDKERVTLTWRGLTRVADRERSDVGFVLVASEPLADAPRGAGHYLAILDAFAANPLLDDLPEEMRAALAAIDAKDTEEDRAADPLSALLAKQLGALGKEERAAIRDAIAKLSANVGSSVDVHAKLGEALAPPAPPPVPPPVIPPAPGGKPRLYLREQWIAARDQLARAKAQARALGADPPELAGADAALLDPALVEVDPTLREPTSEPLVPGADLSGQDLSGRDLTGIDLSGAKLEGAVLIGTILRSANLSGASLKGAMLFKADLSGANLKGADLSVVNAANVTAEEADLRGAKLDDAFFQQADLRRARLDGAAGRWVTLCEALLSGARASGIRLDESDLSRAKLDEADLSEASITRSKLVEASARGTNLRRATLDRTSMMDADLSGARLGGARGEQTIWLRARLDGADLERASFRVAHFTGASAKGATFARADLREARLDRVDLTRASFERANLFGADLSRARVDHANFARASLYDAKLVDAAGEGAIFEGANLARVRSSEKG